MSKDNHDFPALLHRRFSNDLLLHLKSANGLPYEELSLFEWYVRETEQRYSEMLIVERDYIQEQVDAEVEDINDSGMLPVQYFIKRSRNSSVLHLAALIEGYFSNVCWRLSEVLGDRILFTLSDLGGKFWVKERKFIERYGNFKIHDELWEKVKIVSDLRNTLIHDRGELLALTHKEREKNINKYKNIPGINAEDYELLVGPEFLDFALCSFRELIELVDNNVGVLIERTVRFRSN
jgi:hypothetical protein